MNQELSISEHLAFSTVRIECKLVSGRTSTGTGFFYDFFREPTQCVPVIVTNKHVVKDAAQGTFYLNEATPEGQPKIGSFHPCFGDDFASGWIEHPDPDVDLCILPIAMFLAHPAYSKFKMFSMPFEQSAIATHDRLKEMAALESLVMVGYPVGIWDEANNMPVFRRGVAASHPYLDYKGRKEFVIDMPCFPGSSGSPIVFIRSGLYTNKMGQNIVGQEVRLMGILYAGPQFTVEGKIMVVPVPTSVQPIPVSRIPTNLGYVIKAERLLDFEPILRRQMENTTTTTSS